MDKWQLITWLIAWPIVTAIGNYLYIKRQAKANADLEEAENNLRMSSLIDLMIYITISIILYL